MRLIFFGFLIFSLFGCKTDNSIIEPKSLENVTIKNINIFPSEINTDTIFVNGKITSNDILNLKINLQFEASKNFKNDYFKILIYQESLENVLFETSTTSISNLNNEYNIHQKEIDFSINRNFIGNLYLLIESDSFILNSIILPIKISRNNIPPEITKIEMPDSVKLTNEIQLLSIYATVKDLNGQNDIKSVKMNSYRLPDSTTIRGTFDLYDDGGKNNIIGNNDKNAGDGIYSLSVQLLPNATKAKYRFEFFATDQANSTSNKLFKEIVIY